MSSWASVSREAASGVSVPRLGRWPTVALFVALLWIFGFAAEARADALAEDPGATPAVADTDTTTEDVASTDGTEPVDPTPTTEPVEPIPATDPVATDPPPEPAPAPEPIPPVTEPTPTPDPAATVPPPEPTPAPEPIPPVAEPIPTTEPPLDTPLPPTAGSGSTDSIVVIDGPPASPLPSPSQSATFAALSGISPADADRRSGLTPAPEHPGNGHPAPGAPDLPQLPAPHNPSAPANPAPGGVGGSGSAPIGVLAALFALAFAGLLGEVLPVSVAALRPPDLAFHLKRPG